VYRVRLESGEERNYATVEAMVADTEAGVITPRAELHHPASNAWVSVRRHPRLVTHLPGSAGTDEVLLDFEALPEPPLNLTRSSDFLGSVAPAAPAAVPFVPPPPPPQAEVEPPLDGDLPPLPGEDELGEPLPDYSPPSDWKPDRSFAPLLRVLGLTAVLAVLGGGGWYAWHTWEERQTTRAIARADSATANVRAQPIDTIPDSVLARALETLRAADTAGTGRAQEIALRDRFSGIPLRPIDKLRNMTPVELRRSYVASYASARAAMDSDFVATGIQRLFSTARLATPDSLRAGRQLVQAARNIFRVYSSNEVQIERAFRDTIAFQTRKSGWTAAQLNDWKSRAILKESYEGAQLADSLLRHTDDVYRLLLSQPGRYRVGGGRIGFDDGAAASEYARLAGWLAARINTIAAVDEAAGPGTESGQLPTARRVVRAFTGTRPPSLEQGSPAPAPSP
jgi:hypothetical protein